jgi:hypothetical protein
MERLPTRAPTWPQHCPKPPSATLMFPPRLTFHYIVHRNTSTSSQTLPTPHHRQRQGLDVWTLKPASVNAHRRTVPSRRCASTVILGSSSFSLSGFPLCANLSCTRSVHCRPSARHRRHAARWPSARHHHRPRRPDGPQQQQRAEQRRRLPHRAARSPFKDPSAREARSRTSNCNRPHRGPKIPNGDHHHSSA